MARRLLSSTLFPYTTLFRSLLEAGGLVGEDEDGTFFAITDEAHAGPDVDGPGDAVAALRNKEDAFAGFFLDPVDGCLNGRAIVGNAVAANGELIGRQVNGVGIVEPRGVKRCPTGGKSDSQEDNSEQYELPHRMTPEPRIFSSGSF